MTKARRATPKIVELYIEVQDIKPLIWRRLLVPLTITLPDLHDILQITLGWTDSHLHSFTFGERSFSMPYDEFFAELEMEDERRKTLRAVLGRDLGEFSYLYDFGDSWLCRIRVTPRPDADPDGSYPLCVGGARAVPPEDVGGPMGYERFLAVIRDAQHEEHDEMLAWVGGTFDPEGFDLNVVNRIMRFGRA